MDQVDEILLKIHAEAMHGLPDISVKHCSSNTMYCTLYRSNMGGEELEPNPKFPQVNGEFLLIVLVNVPKETA